MKRIFNRLLLVWYKNSARELPWRGHVDAYGVWVSEIMLQQTRVETVIPYFQRWMKTFPTLKDLAAADEQDVLNIWEGLGYYSRARSLLKAACLVNEKYSGNIPQTSTELLKLPGIGQYTAAAISSIAYGANEAVLDGNVKRVLARVMQFQEAVNTPEGEKKLWRLAEYLLPEGSAGDYNQALMDLGATLCTPRNPICQKCPVSSLCRAYSTGSQAQFPIMLAKPPIPQILVCAAIIRRDERVLIARRPSKGLLGGLWEFPGGKVEQGETFEEALVREIREELGADIAVEEHFGEYHHAYTHFKVILHAWFVTLTGTEPSALEASELRWVSIEELGEYPMGKIDRSISNDLARINR
jgi:A/G-specific adenine glycosylase